MSRDGSAGVGNTSSRGEIQALTGLRLVAAMIVVLGHFKPALLPYLDQIPLVRPILDAGWLGVEVFFVLSGFVIARSYIEEVGGRLTLAKAAHFIYNRFARVWPVWALLTTLVGAWIWVLRSRGYNADVVVSHPAADLPNYLGQLGMTQMWGVDGIVGPSFVMPGWSISAEWAAYLAFPLLAVVLLPLRRVHALVPLTLATLVMTPMAVVAFRQGPLDPEVHWLLRLTCSFVAGILVAVALLGVRRTRRVEQVAYRVAVGCIAAFVVACFWAYWRRAGDPAHDYAGISVVLFPALIGALSLTSRGPAAWLSRPTMVYGGRISYCLYLVHFVVYDLMLTVLWQNPADRMMTPGLVLAMPFVVLACILLSMALHHGVELPARRFLLSARAAVLSRRTRQGPDSSTTRAPRPRGRAADPALAATSTGELARMRTEAAAGMRTGGLGVDRHTVASGPGRVRPGAGSLRPRDPETVGPRA